MRILSILLFLPLAGTAQTRNDLKGTWTVVNVHKLDSSVDQETWKYYSDSFRTTKFILKADGSCQVSNIFVSKWTFNDKEKTIVLHGLEGNNTVGVSLKSNKWFFIVDDIPVLLEVRKKPT